jgi:hypothetical protein
MKMKMLESWLVGPPGCGMKWQLSAHQGWLIIFTMNLSASVGDKQMPDKSVCIGLHVRKLFNMLVCMCEIVGYRCLYK